MAYDPTDNSLFYSNDLGVEVFNIKAQGGVGCTSASAETNPDKGYVLPEGDLSGLAFDGVNLYSGQPLDGSSGGANTNPPPQIFQTPPDAPIFNFNFRPLSDGTVLGVGAGWVTEDLAFDDSTFTPKCVIWSKRVGSGIAAYEVPCPVGLDRISVTSQTHRWR